MAEVIDYLEKQGIEPLERKLKTKNKGKNWLILLFFNIYVEVKS